MDQIDFVFRNGFEKTKECTNLRSPEKLLLTVISALSLGKLLLTVISALSNVIPRARKPRSPNASRDHA